MVLGPSTRYRVTVLTNIEVSLVNSGFSEYLICELERRLQRVSGIRSIERTGKRIVLYPLSSQYIMSIQTEVENIVQRCIEIDPSLDDKQVRVGFN